MQHRGESGIAGLDGRTEREREVPMHAIAVRQEVQWDERSRSQDDVV